MAAINFSQEKNSQDCYFYYNAVCTKGDACLFRHEPSARTTLVECKYFQMGMCNKPNCSFRHSQLVQPVMPKKMDCYFETQPGGCQKPFCPYNHKNKENIYKKLNVPSSGTQAVCSSEASMESSNTTSSSEDNVPKAPPNFVRRAVVVDLNDGESDSESCCTPVKKYQQPRASSNIADIAKLQELQLKQKEALGYPFSEKAQNPSISDDEVYEYHELVEEVECQTSPSSRSNIKKRILEESTCDLRDILRKNKKPKVSVFDRISRNKTEPSSAPEAGLIEPRVRMNPIRSSETLKTRRNREPMTIFQRTVEGLKKDKSQITDLRSRIKPKKYRTSTSERKAKLEKSDIPSRKSSIHVSSDKISRSSSCIAKEKESSNDSFQGSHLKSKIVFIQKKSEDPIVDDESLLEEELLLGDVSLLDEEELNEDALLY